MTARQVQPSMLPDYGPDRPTGRIVGSVINGTNADLMHAVSGLYLTGSVLDVTYGEGGWWKRFKPEPFTAHDLYKLDGVDFRALPDADASVDTVCFDPPYVVSGGVASSTAGNFLDRFGIGSSRVGAGSIEALILDGLAEAFRVSREWVLVKCMEYSQGTHVPAARSFHDIPHLVTCRAIESGWLKHDQIVHHTGSGPGGHNIFDVKRARRHHSYLLVFNKGGAL